MNQKARTRRPAATHFRIDEYQRLHFFWEELGLTIQDLEDIEQRLPGWTSDMLEVGLAMRNAQHEATERAAPPTAPLTPGATGKIRRKLLGG